MEAASTLERAQRGDRHAFVAYQSAVRSVFQDHLRFRRAAYALVQRFPESRFWAGRADRREARTTRFRRQDF